MNSVWHMEYRFRFNGVLFGFYLNWGVWQEVHCSSSQTGSHTVQTGCCTHKSNGQSKQSAVHTKLKDSPIRLLYTQKEMIVQTGYCTHKSNLQSKQAAVHTKVVDSPNRLLYTQKLWTVQTGCCTHKSNGQSKQAAVHTKVMDSPNRLLYTQKE